jgi:alkanesulfonate monooxygenase SsuD/methylene tetrahydromethanopterin reductase-like flavin-dependent oxidoreductase (luciferase family)
MEELGFDALSFADQFANSRGDKGIVFEMWTLISAVAMATTRIRLQTLVAQIPFRNPALFALQALTVDHVSGGRLEIGLGTGLEVDVSYRMMGIENWSAKERVARFGEYVEIVNRLLTAEETSYQGGYYQIDKAVLCPRPIQSPRPPLIIAALGPVMIGHAARHADIWNTMSFAKTLEAKISEARERVATMNARCAKIGRDPSSLRRSYFMTGGAAFPLYESEKTFTGFAQELIALGFSDLVLAYPRQDQAQRTFERIARNVLPELKAHACS